MNLELRFAVAEDAEDIRREVCIAVASGSYEDIEADAGRRIQVRCFDSFLPGVEGSLILRLVSPD